MIALPATLFPMRYTTLGDSGLKISTHGLGSWLTLANLDHATVDALVGTALDGGINLLDTADIYDFGAAEFVLGRALRGRRREHLVIATKTFFPMSEDPNDHGLSRKHVFESVHGSLRRLDTDYIDVYQFHRYDEETPLRETVMAIGDLMRQGKVLYWGTSMWSAKQIREACRLCDALAIPRPISEQPRYSMLCREVEDEVMPACEELGVGFLFWSPLAQGVLTGKYRRGQAPAGSRAVNPRRFGTFLDDALASEEVARRVEIVAGVAAELGLSMAQLALAWCLRHDPRGAVLVGATSAEQLAENLGAADFEWKPELDRALAPAVEGAPLPL